MDDLEYRIARLVLRPGDMLVIKIPHALSREQLEQLRVDVERVIGKVPCLILNHDVDLAVLTSAEIAAHVADSAL